jgi:hypothetical protein
MIPDKADTAAERPPMSDEHTATATERPSARVVLTKANSPILHFLETMNNDRILEETGEIIVRQHLILGIDGEEQAGEDPQAITDLVTLGLDAMLDSHQPGKPFDIVQPGKHYTAFRALVLAARQMDESTIPHDQVPDDDILWAAEVMHRYLKIEEQESTTWYPRQRLYEAVLADHYMPTARVWEILHQAADHLASFISLIQGGDIRAQLSTTHLRQRQHLALQAVTPKRLNIALDNLRSCEPWAADGNVDFLHIAPHAEDLAVLTAYVVTNNELGPALDSDVLSALATLKYSNV